MFFLEVLLVCNACLTKANNFDQFHSQSTEYVNFKKSNTRTKRCIPARGPMIEKKKKETLR